MILSQRG